MTDQHFQFGRADHGEIQREGTQGVFRRVQWINESSLELRSELFSHSPQDRGDPRSLLRFAHLTDLQLADTRSPARFEYVNRYLRDPAIAKLIPGHRSQEFLASHAMVAMISTLNELVNSPTTGAPLELAIFTGDMVDNAQSNEFGWLFGLLAGGTLDIVSANGSIEHVQSAWRHDPYYWHPDSGRDYLKEHYGFPDTPGLLERSSLALESPGLQIPWIACNGNHEILIQGDGRIGDDLEGIFVGTKKSVDLGSRFASEHAAQFVTEPRGFFDVANVEEVPPDPLRVPIGTQARLRLLYEQPGLPIGHGLTEQNILESRSYFSYDANPVMRIIALDSAYEGGSSLGAISRDQLDWLGTQLAEVSTNGSEEMERRYGRGTRDAYVILTSHHPSSHFRNPLIDGDPRFSGIDEVFEILFGFPNVIAWISGHTHENRITAHPSLSGGPGGFWEITTSSLADWPGESRVVEIMEWANAIEIRTEMVTHSAMELQHGSDEMSLANWHRLISANDPLLRYRRQSGGGPGDRNARLYLPRRF